MDIASLIGIREAAKLLDVSVVRVRQFAAQGRIGNRIAGRYLFTRAEITAFKSRARPTGVHISIR